MNPDFIFALYVFCNDYHSGQSSRLYRILSRLGSHYKVRLSDNAWQAISQGKGSGREEWVEARNYYRQLVRKYRNDKK